jgi:hypothetical protein
VPQQRIDDAPGVFDLLPPREESGVAANDITDQSLVRFGNRIEDGPEIHAQTDRLDVHAPTGALGTDVQFDPIIWLHSEDEDVGNRGRTGVSGTMRGWPKRDSNLSSFPRQTFSGPDVERNPRPPACTDADG